MSGLRPLLAVIPARGGSKGLPGKNIRPLAGLPLIAHSILLAQRCPEIERLIVSTDSEDIAQVARQYGAAVPFLRPAELAQDDTPMWPVLQHAFREMEARDGCLYGGLLLLDPTSPGRLPEDIAGALDRLEARPDADGIVGVSQPEFNPIWNCVVERDGWMVDLVEGAGRYHCRQEVPTVYRVNASLYIWPRRYVLEAGLDWTTGRLLLYEIPEIRAVHIDDLAEFAKAEVLIRSGLIQFPWVAQA